MSNRTFVIGIVVCLAVMVAFGAVIAVLNSGHNRPEGVAEDWLTAVGDTVREGVEADARERAEKIGPLSLADRRLVRPNPDGKTAFPDLEVGKAVEVAKGPFENVRVRFRVHTRRGDDAVEVNGALRLVRKAGDWQVTGVEIAGDANTEGEPPSDVFERLVQLPPLPSEGGPPPASAAPSLWIGALVGAAAIGAISSALVRLAGRPPTVAAAAAV